MEKRAHAPYQRGNHYSDHFFSVTIIPANCRREANCFRFHASRMYCLNPRKNPKRETRGAQTSGCLRIPRRASYNNTDLQAVFALQKERILHFKQAPRGCCWSEDHAVKSLK